MTCSIKIVPGGGYLEITRPDDALKVRIEFDAMVGHQNVIQLTDIAATALVRGVVLLDDDYDGDQARSIAKTLERKVAAAKAEQEAAKHPYRR